jgi:CMP-N,N'-diacetyllegionaminic acid synthase
MRVLGLIPARGQSKGVTRKNARLLGGRPLLAYSADAALSARRLAAVVLTTEDDELATLGRACGLEVPFLRPPELARDETPMVPVVQHALGWLEGRGERFDAVCLLQPTVPFREPGEIDRCVESLEASLADSVITVAPVPPAYNPHWVLVDDDMGYLRLSTGETRPIPRRQDLPRAWHRDGSVYVTRRDVVMRDESLLGTRLIGVEIERASHINIDSPDDWAAAEAMVTARQAEAARS